VKKGIYTFAIMPSSGRRIKTISFSLYSLIAVLISFVLIISLSIGFGSIMFLKAYQKQKIAAKEAVQKYSALCKEVQDLKKSYSDFASILGINIKQTISEPGKGGPESKMIIDIFDEEQTSQNYDAIEGFYSELEPILIEANTLKTNFANLSKAVDHNMAQFTTIPSIWPINLTLGTKAWVSSRFGIRRSPFTGAWEMHEGLDIISTPGTPIISTADGKVIKVASDRFLGNYVEIRHNGRLSTLYAHLENFEPSIYEGKEVKRGTAIGYMGRTGRTTGVHVHYVVRSNGVQVDPMDYILN